MFRKLLIVVSLVIVIGTTGQFAAGQTIQGVCGVSGNQNKVACTLPTLYGPTGVLPVYQVGHLNGGGFDFVNNQSALTATLGTELTTLPLSAPASGYVFQLDKASGLEVRSTQSLGPILAERGDTIGRHKLFVAFSYQYFQFSHEDGIATNAFHNVLQHAQDVPYQDEDADLITTNDSVDLKIHQLAAFLTYGVTDRLDVSAVIPILNVRFGAYSNATILNISTPSFPLHSFCATPLSTPCETQSFSNFKESTGIGDVVFRVKARVWGEEHTKLAAGADLRLPTGDELNFRGSGTWGVRPFVALSYSKSRVSPHANLGFQVNGDSILAGNFSTNTKDHLPNELTYSAGLDLGVTSKFTLAADWLGERVINGFNVRQSSCSTTFVSGTPSLCTVGAAGTSGPYPLTVNYRGAYSMNDIAIGIKVSPIKNLLITANGMFKVDDPGLRAKVVPMIGVGYTF